MIQFWGETSGDLANQSGSPKTSGVIFAMENKCKQVMENTTSAGDTHCPAPRMQAMPLAQEVEVAEDEKVAAVGTVLTESVLQGANSTLPLNLNG